MTEKRFTFNKDTVATNLKTPITYNNKTMSIGEVLEKLNEFAEENEQLRKDATTLICANQDYRHENEKLKSENEDMRRLINNISHQRDEFHHGARENANRVGKLKKENEQLRDFIRKEFPKSHKHILEGFE